MNNEIKNASERGKIIYASDNFMIFLHRRDVILKMSQETELQLVRAVIIFINKIS
jgi:hypothetical protein